MYELGIAHTIGKDTIIMYQNRAGEAVRVGLIWRI